MKNNLFSGGIVNGFKSLDTNPVNGDPLFSNPASGKKHGYQLDDQSPAIDAGVAEPGPPVPGAGTGVFVNVPAYPDVDFFGKPVDFFNGTPNIGACNAKAGEVVAPPANPVQKIAVFPSSLSLVLSESESLTALTIPALADEGGVTWSSDNASVASVDTNGTVTAHTEGWALITATSSNGKSDQCYVKAGNPAPGLSAIARQWMWDNGQDPDAVAIDATGPSGNPLLLHYAMGVSAVDTLPMEMSLVDSQLSITFPGYRTDVSYAGESSADLLGWVPATVTVPDHNGVRTVSAPTGGVDPVFLRVRMD
jgi:hypothetical protein